MQNTTARDYIIRELRSQSRIPGKMKTSISEMDNSTLWWLYNRLRRGASSRSLARALVDRGVGPSGSVGSMAQGITKFRKRIAHLLVEPLKQEIEIPKGLADMEPEERLEAIERAYAQLIEKALLDAKSNGGLMTTDISKHVTALATLSKARAKMPGRPAQEISPTDPNFRAKADLVHARFIGEDAQKWVKATNLFIEELSNSEDVIDVDPETGRLELTEVPRKAKGAKTKTSGLARENRTGKS